MLVAADMAENNYTQHLSVSRFTVSELGLLQIYKHAERGDILSKELREMQGEEVRMQHP